MTSTDTTQEFTTTATELNRLMVKYHMEHHGNEEFGTFVARMKEKENS